MVRFDEYVPGYWRGKGGGIGMRCVGGVEWVGCGHPAEEGEVGGVEEVDMGVY